MRPSVIPDVALSTASQRLRSLEGRRPDAQAEQARLREAANEFEAVMVEMMIRSMRKNVPQTELFGDSRQRELFREMLDGEYARVMVDRGGLGLSEMLVRQLGREGSS